MMRSISALSGFPGVPDHISLWGLLIPIRRDFDQYVNLRPVRLMPGVRSPLSGMAPGDIDFWVVRENSEGEYSQIGGRHGSGEFESVVQTSVFTRRGTDRIIRYAFELATKLGSNHVSSATKSNGLYHSMPFWDERFDAIARDYPGVRIDSHHIDIMAARFVMNPRQFDVVVASNLFGDILFRSGAGVYGHDRLGPFGQYQSGASLPFDVRAGAWVSARHRGQGRRQSDRADLGRGHDARASRRKCRCRQSHGSRGRCAGAG